MIERRFHARRPVAGTLSGLWLTRFDVLDASRRRLADQPDLDNMARVQRTVKQRSIAASFMTYKEVGPWSDLWRERCNASRYYAYVPGFDCVCGGVHRQLSGRWA